MTWSIIESDALTALRAMPEASFDAAELDPPYGLGTREPTLKEILAYLSEDADLNVGGDFMGKDWNIPSVAVWRELFRVLKPGAYAFVFSGTRTQDLISIGLRAAAFEIRDAIDWVYANGFPKSVQVERLISMALCTVDGRHFMTALPKEAKRKPGDHICPVKREGEPFEEHGTALKPGREPIIVARKPLAGTIAANALEHGTGGMNIEQCRVTAIARDRKVKPTGGDAINVFGDGLNGNAYVDGTTIGRWPSNLILSHADGCKPSGKTRQVVNGLAVRHGGVVGARGEGFGIAKPVGTPDMGYGTQELEVYDCVPGCPVAEMDRQSGECPGMTGGGIHSIGYGRGMFGSIDSTRTARGDTGGASRFFFCAKASRGERELGCEHLPARKAAETLGREEGSAGLTPRAGAGRSADEVKNFGPCVKPITLTRYLATMAKPPKRDKELRIIVPYAGTGSEMIGALRAGWDEVVGIQRIADDDERAYVQIARARIARWLEVPEEMDEGEACSEAEDAPPEQIGLFGTP